MADSICARCFHSYVCKHFNDNRDYKNKACRYLNSHFVDVDSIKPVRHGHWIMKKTSAGALYTVCSHCNASIKYNYKYGTVIMMNLKGVNYCPNCGAKMGEVTPNE